MQHVSRAAPTAHVQSEPCTRVRVKRVTAEGQSRLLRYPSRPHVPRSLAPVALRAAEAWLGRSGGHGWSKPRDEFHLESLRRLAPWVAEVQWGGDISCQHESPLPLRSSSGVLSRRCAAVCVCSACKRGSTACPVPLPCLHINHDDSVFGLPCSQQGATSGSFSPAERSHACALQHSCHACSAVRSHAPQGATSGSFSPAQLRALVTRCFRHPPAGSSADDRIDWAFQSLRLLSEQIQMQVGGCAVLCCAVLCCAVLCCAVCETGGARDAVVGTLRQGVEQ